MSPLPVSAEKPAPSQSNGVAKLNGGFADSAFADNKLRPIHRWIPWIAGFPSEFVRGAFDRYLPNKDGVPAVVLDPFCGVGTTLIETLRRGHDAIGFEINPYATLAARTKLEAAAIAPEQIRASNVERGSYGGPGWANYAASYFKDTYRFCRVVSQVLKPGGRAVIVVGNSILQRVEIKVDTTLADLAGRHGLHTESIRIIRQKRVRASIVASSVRQGAKTTASLYESAVVLRHE